MKYKLYIIICLGLLITSCKTTKKDSLDTLDKVLKTEETLSAMPYTVSVKNPTATNDYPTLQSYAFAQSGGKWLMVGGRTNGFHRTSAKESTFPTKTANANIWVMDHSKKEVKSAPLPPSVVKHLRSTNMLFYQDGDWLYCLGGYGSSCDNDAPECYQTWPKLAALNVPSIINKIWNSTGVPDLSSDILTIDDENMRITGGGLKKMGDYFYAVFGHNYASIYKGGVVGTYTEEVRRFRIFNDGKQLRIINYEAYKDPTGITGPESQYHRRDLGVVSAIRPDGTKGISVYGGVFNKDGGGWMNPIYIDADATGKARVTVDKPFQQKFNQYECAHVLMYDSKNKNMFTTFLGGISFYYFNKEGNVVPSTDSNWLPFVKTINNVVRVSERASLEFPQNPSSELPGYLGANAIFVIADGVATYRDSPDIIDYIKLPVGESMVGYMYGGIEATEPQASQMNPTFASGKVYKVYVNKR